MKSMSVKMPKIGKMTSVFGVSGFVFAMLSALVGILCISVSAADIFAVAKGLLGAVLASVQDMSTILACACIAICALILIFTKDQKASDSALSWLKRIIIAVILINTVGSVMTYVISKVTAAGGQKTVA